MLEEMGHPQPPAPIQIDNSTALGVVTNIIQPKCTKAMDMRFHWLCCRTIQKQFRTYWRAGSTSLANNVTKHHPPIHHRTIQPLHLNAPTKLAVLQHKFQGILTPIESFNLVLTSAIPAASAALSTFFNKCT
jgi:hypothetical protein